MWIGDKPVVYCMIQMIVIVSYQRKCLKVISVIRAQNNLMINATILSMTERLLIIISGLRSISDHLHLICIILFDLLIVSLFL